MPKSMLAAVAIAAGLGQKVGKVRQAAADDDLNEQDQDLPAEVTDEEQPASPVKRPAEEPADTVDEEPDETPAEPDQPPKVVARSGAVIGNRVVKSNQSFSFVSGLSRNSAAAAAVRPAPTAAAKGSESVEATAYIASLEARGHRVDANARSAIAGYAKTWSASADVRAEFGAFEVFASFMRAKDKGAVRIFGQ